MPIAVSMSYGSGRTVELDGSTGDLTVALQNFINKGGQPTLLAASAIDEISVVDLPSSQLS